LFSVDFLLLKQNNDLSPVLNNGKSQKLYGVRYGKYVGWGMAGIWFFTKNCHTV
jgi:hypothetical protein